MMSKATKSGSTPLHSAAGTNRADVVRFLVEKEAPQDLRDEDGLTPCALLLNLLPTTIVLTSYPTYFLRPILTCPSSDCMPPILWQVRAREEGRTERDRRHARTRQLRRWQPA